MSLDQKPATASLVFSFAQVRPEGSVIQFSEKYSELFRESEKNEVSEDLQNSILGPIEGELFAMKVGSKLHVKGRFQAKLRGDCDRCGDDISFPIEGDCEYLLLPDLKDEEGGARDEDSHFSHFDGERVDLRPLVREALILELPMRFVPVDEKGCCRICRKPPAGRVDRQNKAFEAERAGSSAMNRALSSKTAHRRT